MWQAAVSLSFLRPRHKHAFQGCGERCYLVLGCFRKIHARLRGRTGMCLPSPSSQRLSQSTETAEGFSANPERTSLERRIPLTRHCGRQIRLRWNRCFLTTGNLLSCRPMKTPKKVRTFLQGCPPNASSPWVGPAISLNYLSVFSESC